MKQTRGTKVDINKVFPGGGEMGDRIRAFDWSKTPLGPVESWSSALKTMLRIMLANRFPHILWWGPHYIQFYNDPYRPIPGAKHPQQVLGRRASECWSEIWPIIGPLIDRPFRGGPATWDDDILLVIARHGFLEETHFTIAYSPVPDETVPSGIGGVLATVHEITEKVVGERRIVALRDLGARIADAKTAEGACSIAAKTLAAHDRDVPFVMLYLIEPDGKRARLAGASGVTRGREISPVEISLAENMSGGWPLEPARTTGTLQVVRQLAQRFGTIPPGPWPDAPDSAVVIPIPSNKSHELAGFMIAGISARLKFDEFYRDFFELLRTQIATAIANARAYEEEKERAEALAEIDRAKTAFFSNVSHEFRTPLTLMLGPIEDALRAAPDDPSLQLAHRNSVRLLKLVNTLLDFSRIESGRIQASYQPTDLAAFTVELASVFRSAIEKAGLQLLVDCQPVPEPVYVDRDMWEKIVLNLLSNALKFTFDGEIRLTLRSRGERVELAVSDTGVGIPETELPKIFQRFHRVRGTRSRTHEGTGIGLALVRQLVALHGGDAKVESKEGQGTTFTVSVRTGSKHLAADRINAERMPVAVSPGAMPLVEEACQWLPTAAPIEDAVSGQTPARRDGQPVPRILLADDNRDMRDYLQRLLGQFYSVDAVGDGEEALASIRKNPPALVLTDVMMPRLDGFGLLQAIRSDERTRTLPVIMLSARAGEESRVEGLDAGADDYLIKPFSARELFARVAAHLKLARIRREAEEKLEETVAERTASLREVIAQMEEFSYTVSHDLQAPLRGLHGDSELLLQEFGCALPPDAVPCLKRIVSNARQLNRTVLDVLTLTRLARADVTLEKIAVEKLLRRIVEQYPSMQKPHAQIEIETLPEVLGHEPSLTQAFSNLLNNAVKFVPPDVPPRVRVRSERNHGNVRLWVEDNGIGIEPQYHDRLFKMFERIHPHQKYEGTGVGLAIVKKAVERMGGTVGVESNGVNGSRFWIQMRAVE